MPYSSQGSSVTFDSVSIGWLTGWDASPGSAQFADITGMDSPAVGSGEAFRVIRQYDCTLVDPGTISISVFGCPPYTIAAIGTKAGLGVSFSGGSFSVEAYLQDFQVTGRVGEFLTGSATFRLTGNDFV